MNTIIRNILGLIAGVFVGGAVNMGIVMMSGSIIPPPAGADTSTMEGLKEAMHLFEARHFIFPFLAHACGTFVGAFVAALLAASHQLKFALAIGGFFFLGGLANIILLPSPLWFSLLDLLGAYLPMAYMAYLISGAKSKV